jgi:hypothetical protein
MVHRLFIWLYSELEKTRPYFDTMSKLMPDTSRDVDGAVHLLLFV